MSDNYYKVDNYDYYIKLAATSLARLADRYAPRWTATNLEQPPLGERVLLFLYEMNDIIVGYRVGENRYVAAWVDPQPIPVPTYWCRLPEHPMEE